MLEKFYTRRKTKVADVADNQDGSIYNFPVEVEVERPTNTFKQGSNKYFRSSCKFLEHLQFSLSR